VDTTQELAQAHAQAAAAEAQAAAAGQAAAEAEQASRETQLQARKQRVTRKFLTTVTWETLICRRVMQAASSRSRPLVFFNKQT
jgi:hypothetical protein